MNELEKIKSLYEKEMKKNFEDFEVGIYLEMLNFLKKTENVITQKEHRVLIFTYASSACLLAQEVIKDHFYTIEKQYDRLKKECEGT